MGTNSGMSFFDEFSCAFVIQELIFTLYRKQRMDEVTLKDFTFIEFVSYYMI